MHPLLIDSLHGRPIERPPVWLMRQAGRYLPEYRELKSKYSFLELCQTPKLAAKITMQPMLRFNPDAAIVFSDILLISQCLGINVAFNPGPIIDNPIRSTKDIYQLKGPSPRNALSFVYDTLDLVREELETRAKNGIRKTLLGFAGAPWTLACYFIDQTPFKHFEKTKILAYSEPEPLKALLKQLTELLIEYLLEQLEHGADAVQLFDSWAGILTETYYREIVLPHLKQIAKAVQQTGKPLILYTGQAAHLLPTLAEVGACCLSLDSSISLTKAEEILGPNTCIQGNFDPALLFSSSTQIKQSVVSELKNLSRRTRYIANLGHGVLQQTPPAHVQAFISACKEGWS